MKNLIVLCMILSMAGLASAAVWNPAANGITPPDTGDWGTPANWDNNAIPVGSDKVVFNIPDAAECIISGPAVCSYIVQGDGGPGGVTRIVNGGALNTGTNWTGIGFNNTAHMIVETGGSARFGGHLWVGQQANGIGMLDINGGYVEVKGGFGCNFYNNAGTYGFVNVNVGELNLDRFNDVSAIHPDSNVDIKFGRIVIIGNESGNVKQEVTDGRITGFGHNNNVRIVVTGGNTILTAIDFPTVMNIAPADESTVKDTALTELIWSNDYFDIKVLEPNVPEDSIYYDVWFGTEPNKLSSNYTRIVSGTTGTSAAVPGVPLAVGTYYWEVDAYIYGKDGTGVLIGEPIEGFVYSFNVTDDLPPTLSAMNNQITWSGQEVQLVSGLGDDGKSNVTVTWTADPAEGVSFTPGGGVTYTYTGPFSGYADPKVTMTHASTEEASVTVSVSVGDVFNPTPVEGSVLLRVFKDACQATREGNGQSEETDLNEDCVTNLKDFAIIAAAWLNDYTLTAPVTK